MSKPTWWNTFGCSATSVFFGHVKQCRVNTFDPPLLVNCHGRRQLELRSLTPDNPMNPSATCKSLSRSFGRLEFIATNRLCRFEKAASQCGLRVGVRVLLSCFLVTAAGTTLGQAQSYTFTNVTDTTEEFSGLFSPPQLNAGGTLQFSARLDNGHSGTFTKAAGGPTTTIVSTAPSFGGLASSGGSINASGTVAFQGDNPTVTPSQAIYTGAGGAHTLIAGNESTSPFSEFGSSGVEAINDSGTVAFYARHRASAGGGEGIFTRSGGTGPIITVADSTSGMFNQVSSQPSINAGGSVAFSAAGTTSAVGEGIFVVAPGGAVTTIADASDGLTSPATSSLNNSGTVVFLAFAGSVRGIYTGNGAALTTVANDSGDYRQFLFTPAINNNGMVVFNALLEDSRRGIFAGPDPVADKVIIVGDTLFGATVSDVTFFRGLNDNGDIAFLYSLENGVTGVALAAAMPAPPAITVTKIVGASTAIPGGTGNFTSLHSPAFAVIAAHPSIGSGNAVFLGAGSGGQQGIYRVIPSEPVIPGNPVKLADLNTAIPEGTGNFTGFFPQLSTHGGEAAVLATGAGGQQGIYRFIPTEPMTKVADLNTAIPDGTGNFTAFPLASPVISNGNVAFLGNGSGGQQGIYRVIPTEPTIPGEPVKVADLNTAIPSGSGNFTGFVGSPAISGNNVAFIANGSGGQQGVYVTIPTEPNIPGNPVKVADTATTMPGSADSFQFFESVSMDRSVVSAALAFVGGGTVGGDPMKGVYVSLIGPPIKVADFATSIPEGTGMFSDFGAVAFDPDAAGNPITASRSRLGRTARYLRAVRRHAPQGGRLGRLARRQDAGLVQPGHERPRLGRSDFRRHVH
jgi:hypothetical protein